MLGLTRGEPVNEIFSDLYHFFTQIDLATVAMDNLSEYGEEQCASLIRTMADVYNTELFKGAVLGDLMDKINDIHIRHFAANATDFTNGLALRTFGHSDNGGSLESNSRQYA